MTLPSFISNLQTRLEQELPGLDAQLQMLPIKRKRTLPDEKTLAKARKAAVCMLLYQKNEQWQTVLIQRTTYEGVHSGQIAFPGGKYEEGDDSLMVTALRETEEEIGILQEDLQTLGALSQVYIPPSNMLVLPVVAYLPKEPKFRLQDTEVAKTLEVDLTYLANPAIRTQKQVTVVQGLQMTVPCYDVHDHVVWGATAVMLSEWLVIWEELTS